MNTSIEPLFLSAGGCPGVANMLIGMGMMITEREEGVWRAMCAAFR